MTALAAHLVHVCRVERDAAHAASPRDGHQRRIPDWRPHLADVPCRLVTRTQRVADGLGAELAIVTTYTLLVPATTDVRAGIDRIVGVTDRTGESIEPGPFAVTALLRRTGGAGARSHVSLSLELQGGRHAA